jgi:hypothetical protein
MVGPLRAEFTPADRKPKAFGLVLPPVGRPGREVGGTVAGPLFPLFPGRRTVRWPSTTLGSPATGEPTAEPYHVSPGFLPRYSPPPRGPAIPLPHTRISTSKRSRPVRLPGLQWAALWLVPALYDAGCGRRLGGEFPERRTRLENGFDIRGSTPVAALFRLVPPLFGDGPQVERSQAAETDFVSCLYVRPHSANRASNIFSTRAARQPSRAARSWTSSALPCTGNLGFTT